MKERLHVSRETVQKYPELFVLVLILLLHAWSHLGVLWGCLPGHGYGEYRAWEGAGVRKCSCYCHFITILNGGSHLCSCTVCVEPTRAQD